MSIPSLVVHWLHTHRVLAADLPHLHHVKVLRYEDLAKRPGPSMKRILTWLKLPPARIDVSDVSASTNQKYEQEYCSGLLNDLSMARAHCVASGVLQPLIAPMGLDYDVRDGGPVDLAASPLGSKHWRRRAPSRRAAVSSLRRSSSKRAHSWLTCSRPSTRRTRRSVR